MMITKAEAIKSLHPTAEFIYRHEAVNEPEITWISTDIPQPSDDVIVAEVARLEAEQAATEYKRLRAPEYPAIGDQLDAILKHLNYRRTQGDDLVQEMDDIIGDWLAVKARFPKNG